MIEEFFRSTGFMGIGTFAGLEVVYSKQITLKKHLGRLFSTNIDINDATINHLSAVHGIEIVSNARNNPKWTFIKGHLSSIARKVVAVGCLILIHKMVPGRTSVNVIPGQDHLTNIFFKSIQPLAGKPFIQALSHYHIVDLTPIFMKMINLYFEWKDVQERGENSTIKSARIWSDRFCHFFESFWWLRVGLITIAGGPGDNVSLSTAFLTLIDKFTPLRSLYPNLPHSDRNLLSVLSRTYALIAAMSALTTTLFHKSFRRDIEVLQNLILQKEICIINHKSLDQFYSDVEAAMKGKKIDPLDRQQFYFEITEILSDDKIKNNAQLMEMVKIGNPERARLLAQRM